MKNIQKCADVVNTNVIEHTAFIRASAAQNNINLDQYREQVRRELMSSNSEKKNNDGNVSFTYAVHRPLI